MMANRALVSLQCFIAAHRDLSRDELVGKLVQFGSTPESGFSVSRRRSSCAF